MRTPPSPAGTVCVFPSTQPSLGPSRATGFGGTAFGLSLLAAGAIVGAGFLFELQTSSLQARLLSNYAARLSYETGPGPSPRVAFPHSGPFDRRRGYSRLPEFQSRLEAAGFRVARQARVSPELARLVAWGVAPPYREPSLAGLTIRGTGGTVLYDAAPGDRLFAAFEHIPPLLVEALLFMENQELLQPLDPRSNPAIEWDRLTKASFLYAGVKLGLPLALQGGSTLATQLEKFRHSPNGRTDSALEKLRQLVGASLNAYRDGPDTGAVRREIVLDYLNTMPLAAAPGYGEVHGLGAGLHAWFGMDLPAVGAALASSGLTPAKVRAFKHALALLAAVRAPTTYLVNSHSALAGRVNEYTRLLMQAGTIDADFAQALADTPITFSPRAPSIPTSSFVQRKAPNAIRTTLLRLLDVPSLYELDRLHLTADSSIDSALQNEVIELFRNLADPDFVASHGLNQKRLLLRSDPRKVVYSLMLLERTAAGNALRVQVDSLEQPFDVNYGMKMDLGSTGKLRAVAHYLELVALLHREFSPLDDDAVAQRARVARDPITRWAAATLRREKSLDLDSFLQRALDRRYSASPDQVFFTGAAVHSFRNFNRRDDERVLSVREGLRRSTNLVFIRLMRDLVRFHTARLPYDPEAVRADADHPERQRLLVEIAEQESERYLYRTYRRYRGLSPDAVIDHMLGSRATSPRQLSLLYLAWHPEADEEKLRAWLGVRLQTVSTDQVGRLMRAYGNPRLNLADYGYLLARHPLEVWYAGELVRDPDLSWKSLLERSSAARRVASAWLFNARNRRPQDLRLRIRAEQDAFDRMTPYWRRLGFPFERLSPTYATALGNSSDRPAALAELMGIIVNDGVRRPAVRLTRLRFAEGTPYETTFEPLPRTESVMEPAVARALRGALADTVASGTGRRVAGAFVLDDGTPVIVGGKTGSGDNRFKTFNRRGAVTSSRAVNRTATFVFYVADRYFGVLTAFVPGRDAAAYSFTSSLPLAVLKLLAPAINSRLAPAAPPRPGSTASVR